MERVLLSHPSVAEAAVVGVDDEKWGQTVGAVVVLRGGLGGSGGAARDAIEEWCRDHLAREKVPRRWCLVRAHVRSRVATRRSFMHGCVGACLQVDAIPKNAMGKVNKKQLVAAVAFDSTVEST